MTTAVVKGLSRFT